MKVYKIELIFKISIVILMMSISHLTSGQLAANEILKKCIQKHDPKKKWKNMKASFDIGIKRDGATDRQFTVSLNTSKRIFSYEVKSDTLQYAQGYDGKEFWNMLNGQSHLSDDLITKYNLGIPRTQYLKDVYEYLLLLPMRLEYDTEHLSEQVEDVIFNHKSCFKITINYEPVAEKEIWHFFIEKQFYLLVGLQFYLKDPKTNGEYIYLENFENHKGILMPMVKKWYWNKDDSFFRTDQIYKVRKYKTPTGY